MENEENTFFWIDKNDGSINIDWRKQQRDRSLINLIRKQIKIL